MYKKKKHSMLISMKLKIANQNHLFFLSLLYSRLLSIINYYRCLNKLKTHLDLYSMSKTRLLLPCWWNFSADLIMAHWHLWCWFYFSFQRLQ